MPSTALYSADDAAINLLSAFVSVSKWSIEKTSRIHDGFARQNLFDFAVVRELSVDEIAARLLDAGYRPADYVRHLVARRLHKFLGVFGPDEFENLRKAIAVGDTRLIERQLLGRPGIGPTVLRNFLELQGLR
jgi:hypothetical protein